MAVVLAEMVAGAAVLLWFSPLWSQVKPGFFKLMGALLAVLALACWFSASSASVAGQRAGQWSVRLALASTGVILASTVLMFVRQRAAARIVGWVSVLVACATLAAMAATGRQSSALAFAQLLAGAAFLGTVLDGLMLGHWYLTDRGLPRRPINRFTEAMILGVVLEAIAVISGGFSGTGSSAAFNPLLTAGALAPWIALGMVAATGLIAAITRAALKGERASAVQSATGFYYLAVVTSLTAELAVKTRFFAS
jgi:hypothetical protein